MASQKLGKSFLFSFFLETATKEGRSSLSLIVKPFWISWTYAFGFKTFGGSETKFLHKKTTRSKMEDKIINKKIH